MNEKSKVIMWKYYVNIETKRDKTCINIISRVSKSKIANIYTSIFHRSMSLDWGKLLMKDFMNQNIM